MSYCRWSSDSHKSDVYVYESYDGFEVHIASNRYVLDDSFQEPVWTGNNLEEHQNYHEILANAETVNIDLPYAGESFSYDTGHEAAELLTELSDLGYHVPDGVIDELRSDTDE